MLTQRSDTLLSRKDEEVVLCSCGREMTLYPEAYLCTVCDSEEVAKIGMEIYKNVLKRLGINTN